MRPPLPQPPPPDRPHRILVIGTTGSGKTTLARALSRRLAVPHVELDALTWEANWQNAPPEVFRARVAAAVSAPGWVTDGGYSAVRDLTWGGATLLVWLDYPFPLVFTRLVRRTLRRIVTREALWNGNRERFATQFFTRDSLLLWAFQSHWRHRRTWAERLSGGEYPHLVIHRFLSPRETTRWLASIPAATVDLSPEATRN